MIDFLQSASIEPSALVVEGDAGIGKTELWLAALDLAGEQGFRVLSARPAAAESVMAYAALADMLSVIQADAWPDLPPPQQLALDRALLRASADGPTTDQRAVAAGFLSVVDHLASITPVILAIDDLQWLDSSSMQVVAFAARRLSGPIGVLGTLRTERRSRDPASWLSMPPLDGLKRIKLGPLSLGALHAVVSERLGRAFSRPTMVQIHAVSDGNPFYALELARAIDEHSAPAEMPLSATLSVWVGARVGGLDPQVKETLLAIACAAMPTVALVARAVDTDIRRVLTLLEVAESEGVIAIDGQRLRFSHPLLAKGVYTDAAPAQRRSMHRRLARIVEEPELHARHLALAATTGDPQTVRSLDRAADMARIRGAPAAAAELLQLAVGLGGDTVERRMMLARYHFHAGDHGRAEVLLEETIDVLAHGPLRSQALGALAGVRLVGNSFQQAAELLERAIEEAGQDIALRAELLLPFSFALVHIDEAAAVLQVAEEAVSHADKSGQRQLLSHALGWLVCQRMIAGGDGCDHDSMSRALDLDDGEQGPVMFRPRMVNAQVLAWSGHLRQAREQMRSIRRGCIERGEESELAYVCFHSGLIEIWRGDYTEAGLIADDAMERALQLDNDLPLSAALTIRSIAAAYTGRHRDARSDAEKAIVMAQRWGTNRLAEWPIAILGFVDVSLGDYDAALTALGSLVVKTEAAPKATEIHVCSWIPDAVEAMIHLGRFDEAKHLVDILEGNGRRLERAWMLAVGARCRSMLLAAYGDLAAANRAAHAAMLEHDRLPMPFERARTQLLLGQLLRRQRQRAASTATLREALSAFTSLGARLWADRAAAELGRTNVAPGDPTGLSPSEERVAQLAACGMTNRDVAAALFISPKTVEANLGRIYHKLGIHSRAELGRLVGQSER